MIRTIAGFSARRPVVVILIWLGMVGAGFGIGIGVFDRLTTQIASVPGSESDRAGNLLDTAEPRPETLTAVLSGLPATDATLRADLEAALADVRAIPGVVDAGVPVPSPETGNAVLVTVDVAPGPGAGDAAEAVAARLREVPVPALSVAGGPLTDGEFADQAQSDVQRAELITLPLVLLLLVVIFRGLLPATLPLLVAVAGIGVTFGVLYAFSVVDSISVYAIQVVTMLSIGLAVDYALLIVNRFREERAVDPDVPGAITRTFASAGRTVAFSGLTVVASLAGITVFPDVFLRSMGLAGAAVVAVDMLAALTLLPALLALVGRRIAPAGPRRAGGGFARVARAVQRRPVVAVLVTTGTMLVLAFPALDLRLGLSDARSLPVSTQTRLQHDALAEHFPALIHPDPVIVAAQTTVDDPGVATLRDRIAAIPEVSDVDVIPGGPRLTLLRAVPDWSPGDTDGQRVVAAVRELSAPFPFDVGGQAARLSDYRVMLAERAPWAIGIVVLATLLLLFAFTGSVLLPVKAVLTNVVSIGAALGAVVWVFQSGHLASWFSSVRLDSTDLTVPVLVAAIAFGLSVDYEMFLLSRIRERWLAGVGDRAAVAEGVQRTGRIVTSAALLLAVVFGGFMVGGFVPIKAIGLGLVVAVVLDATVVRMVLVPATMTIAGRYNWWAPAGLRRLHQRVAVHVLEEPAQVPAQPRPEKLPV